MIKPYPCRRTRYKTVAAGVIVAAIVFSGFPGALWGARTDAAAISGQFRQANELFKQANTISTTDPDRAQKLYRKAVMRFERIVRQGHIHNGKLYYNIGNAYFRMNDIGRAILNYRRAQQYIPNDPNLQQNLDFARAKRLDHLEEKQKTRILKTLFFWHYDLPTGIRASVFAAACMLLFIVASLRIFIRKPFLGWCLAVPALLALLFGGSLGSEYVYLQKTRPGVIISSAVTARKGNSETYAPSFKEPLHAGTEFVLIEKRDRWGYIELPDARRCWVLEADIEMVR